MVLVLLLVAEPRRESECVRMPEQTTQTSTLQDQVHALSGRGVGLLSGESVSASMVTGLARAFAPSADTNIPLVTAPSILS